MRWLPLLVAALLSSACVKPVALDAAIQPALPSAGRSSEKAGVVCSPDLLEYVERAHPSTLTGFATSYRFDLGEPLCNALFRSVEGSYRAAVRATTPYHRGQFGRVVQFALQDSSLSIAPRPDRTTRVAYTLSVVVERYGRDLRLESRNVISGYGLLDARVMSDAVVKEVVEDALQQVANETTTLLVARIDGPRVAAPGGYDPAAPED
jgi:hypothetical protein